MIVHGRMPVSLSDCIPSVERKTWLKILGFSLEDMPDKWDKHLREMLRKASGKIIRVCKYIL